MKFGVLVALAVGIAVTVYLLFHVGFESVFATIAHIGWDGFGILCLYWVAMFFALGAAWFVLIPGQSLSRLPLFVWGRWIRDAASDILPFSAFGGFVIGARAVILRGLPSSLAFGSTVVDVTAELVAQVAFVLFALGVGLRRLQATPSTEDLPLVLIIGVAVVLAGGIGFIVVQLRGHAFTQKLAQRFFPGVIHHTTAFHQAVDMIYQSSRRLALAVAIHFMTWIGSAISVQLTVLLMGAQLNLSSAIAIEGILCAMRSGAVFVPSAIGVQEAGYALLMPLFGLGPEMGLAISLIKRSRELVTEAPGLLLWQFLEGQNALAKRGLPASDV